MVDKAEIHPFEQLKQKLAKIEKSHISLQRKNQKMTQIKYVEPTEVLLKSIKIIENGDDFDKDTKYSLLTSMQIVTFELKHTDIFQKWPNVLSLISSFIKHKQKFSVPVLPSKFKNFFDEMEPHFPQKPLEPPKKAEKNSSNMSSKPSEDLKLVLETLELVKKYTDL
ncbi:hypothetical protein MHBO_005296 [Bonamia ostreae]|uniref:Uncharacterized protein n=1 Tax=Bonamia ostreae TaxID=126728 RepID=A0ABV2AJH1_9EUKA